MAEAVYILCMLTSIACAVLLLRAHGQTRLRLLLWSGLCFVGLAVNNMVLFADRVLFPGMDLTLPRIVSGLVGVSILLFGLIWEGR